MRSKIGDLSRSDFLADNNTHNKSPGYVPGQTLRRRGRLSGRGRWALRERHFRYRVRVLESDDQPFAVLLLQELSLNTLLRFWKSFWSACTDHGPADMRYRHLCCGKSDFYIADGKNTFSEDKRVSCCELLLNFSPPFPPPTNHVNAIAIFTEQSGVGFSVVPIPGILLLLLKLPDCRRVGFG